MHWVKTASTCNMMKRCGTQRHLLHEFSCSVPTPSNALNPNHLQKTNTQPPHPKVRNLPYIRLEWFCCWPIQHLKWGTQKFCTGLKLRQNTQLNSCNVTVTECFPFPEMQFHLWPSNSTVPNCGVIKIIICVVALPISVTITKFRYSDCIPPKQTLPKTLDSWLSSLKHNKEMWLMQMYSN